MLKKLFWLFLPILFLCLLVILPSKAHAQQMPSAFVNVVNSVRGSDFWDLPNQKPADALSAQIKILRDQSVPATWLIRFDALNDEAVVRDLKSVSSNDELGLFLEVTPSWTKEAGVNYHQSALWHNAGSIFLTGYSQSDRLKLIDSSFEKFKSTLGYYPKSLGAWWIDSYSLQYMREKYGVVSSLEVADQYSTDNYQIWGQYWSTPYYPAKRNALFPAQSANDKIGTVTLQWAARDPVNGYGGRVEDSTYSVQVNDYLDYHNLDSNYFGALVDLYTKQPYNQFNQLTVGLENSYSWSKYGGEYQKQIQVLASKRAQGQFQTVTMSGFASWYDSHFPDISPRQIIVADDPLGSSSKVVWLMNPYYRAGWFRDSLGSEFKDIRAYIAGSTEICFNEPCNNLDFGSTAIRVLDSVSFNKTYLLDQGSISNFQLSANNQSLDFSYTNEAGAKRAISLLPRDISVDGVVKSIDTTILDALSSPQPTLGKYALSSDKASENKFTEKPLALLVNALKYLLFVLCGVLFPGMVFLKKIFKENKEDESLVVEIFLSLCLGLVGITLTAYILGYLHLYLLTLVYVIGVDVLFFKKKLYLVFKGVKKISIKTSLPFGLIILAGVVFQYLPVFRSGWVYDFGLGFWGPNGHDGVWHLSLINQLVRGLPPDNPVFSDAVLKNYHYLYDLLLTTTRFLTRVDSADLLFRFYPLLLSLILGLGTYSLSSFLFKKKMAVFFSLFFVYFAGSFGWIVDYIHQKTLSGESDFWANQSISFNLNPPFAISLVITLALFYFLLNFSRIKTKTGYLLVALLVGSLIGFKSYAGILVLGSLGVVALVELLKGKGFCYLKLFIPSVIISLAIFIPNFTFGQQFFIFSPFWLVNSVIDSPDRVGWLKLSAARQAYLARGQWPKFFFIELVSLLIFFVGNLGMRVLSIALITNLRKKTSDYFVIFAVIFSLLSILIPLIFIQQGNDWNIVQFLYYLLFISSLLTGGVLAYIFYKFPKSFGVLITIGVLILTPINSVSTAKSYIYPSPHTFVSFNELEALKFLSNQPKGTVLTYPFQKDVRSKLSDPVPLFAYDTTAYVGAFSHQGVYLEDLIQNEILQTGYVKRLDGENNFFSSANYDLKNNFLKESNIKYIYLLKYFNISLDTTKLHARQIFDNPEVIIYETI